MENTSVTCLRKLPEPLAAIFEIAELACIVWLKFDSEAALIDGLPIFEIPELAS